jgi:hypothetical protein
MAQAGAMIDIIRAENGSEQLLQKIIVFVGRFGARISGYSGWPRLSVTQTAAGLYTLASSSFRFPFIQRERLVRFLTWGFCGSKVKHAGGMVNKIITKPAFDTSVWLTTLLKLVTDKRNHLLYVVQGYNLHRSRDR